MTKARLCFQMGTLRDTAAVSGYKQDPKSSVTGSSMMRLADTENACW